MSELTSDAESLVEAGRAGDAPTPDDKARIKNRLALELGAAVFASGALAAGLHEAAQPALGTGGRVATDLAKRGTLKLLATAGSIAALVGGVLWIGTSAPVERRVSPALTRAPVHEEPAQEEPAQAAPEVSEPVALVPEKARARAPRSIARATQPKVTSDTLAAELSLLSRAQQALREHAPADALRIVRQHADSFPRGALQEERSGIEALAHCLLGETSHASVARFLSAHPSSPVAARVRKECALP